MSRIHVVARLEIAKELLNEFLQQCNTIVHKTNKERGCIYYNIHRLLDTKREKETGKIQFAFIEAWENMKTLDDHSKSQHLKDFRQYLNENKDKCTSIDVEIYSNPLISRL